VDLEKRISEHLAAGMGMLKAAKMVGVGSGTVQKVARAMKVQNPPLVGSLIVRCLTPQARLFGS
jgi:hypothetical protein